MGQEAGELSPYLGIDVKHTVTSTTSKKNKNGFMSQTLSSQIGSISSLLEISKDVRKRPG